MIVRKIIKFAACAALAVAVMSSAAMADPIDLVVNFPDNQGGNGLYAQAYSPVSSTYRNLDDLGTKVFGSSGQQNAVTAVLLSQNAVLMVPKVNGTIYGTEWAVLSYLVPQTGNYSISGGFLNMYGATTALSIYTDNNTSSPLWTASFPAAGGAGASATFSLTNVALSQNTMLRFAVDPGAADYIDSVSLTGTVTPATATLPEPGSLAVLGSGLVGVIGLFRRRS